MNCISKAVALRILELLNKYKMTRYELEKKSCISHDTLKSIIKGKSKGVNLKTILLIADGFNLTISEFLDSELFKYENINID